MCLRESEYEKETESVREGGWEREEERDRYIERYKEWVWEEKKENERKRESVCVRERKRETDI